MHSSTFLPFTQRGWKENESREISCFNETTPRFIDVLLPLLPFLLLLLFPVLIVLTRSSLNALFFPSKKKNRWEWSSEEKKRKEGKRRKNGDIPSTSFLLFISLYIYIFHNVRIARVLIKKRKSRLRRRKYTKLDHRGFHRKRRMFSQRMIEKLLRQ